MLRNSVANQFVQELDNEFFNDDIFSYFENVTSLNVTLVVLFKKILKERI